MGGLLLAIRSLFWTVTCPGVVAGAIPWFYFGVREVTLDHTNPLHLAGAALIAAGVALLGACIVEFARRGRGTLSPVDPPTVLVVAGLYRYVRNPMYLGVLTILAGETLLTQSSTLALYAIAFFAMANVFILAYEEPHLRRRFGDSYERYKREVSRWIPRRPAA